MRILFGLNCTRANGLLTHRYITVMYNNSGFVAHTVYYKKKPTLYGVQVRNVIALTIRRQCDFMLQSVFLSSNSWISWYHGIIISK